MTAKILIIEDNDDNLQLMSYLLAAWDHSPILAQTGDDGIQTARREKPDLILCDILLPDQDGYELVKDIKNDPALRQTPIVAVTALAMVGDKEKTLRAGFDGYIPKPINPESFVGEVEVFLHPALRGSRVVPRQKEGG